MICVGGRIHLAEIKTDLRDTTFAAEMCRILILIEKFKKISCGWDMIQHGALMRNSFGFNLPTKHIKFIGYE